MTFYTKEQKQQLNKELELRKTSDITAEEIRENVTIFEKLCQEYEEQEMTRTALFFSDKLLTITNEDPDEVLRFAELLYKRGEYHRAAHWIILKDLHLKSYSGRLLAARCCYSSKDYLRAFELLSLPCDYLDPELNKSSLNELKSSVELLKGQIHEAMSIGFETDKEARDEALKCYIEALRLDFFCSEAFDSILKFGMLKKEHIDQLTAILDEVVFHPSDNQDAIKLVKGFYQADLEKFNQKNQIPKIQDDEVLPLVEEPKTEELLNESVDMQFLKADEYYERFLYDKCYAIVNSIYSKDMFHPKATILLVNCLLDLRKESVLQKVSHKLVEANPESPISWYAVGCFYYLTSNYEQARKYFSKSTSMDRNFQPSMMMFGHSFEQEALHDQALAVYLDLTQVVPNSYLPLFYVGIEYLHLNNLVTADRYLKGALSMSPDNPIVIHEIGIMHYRNGRYEEAKKYLLEALSLISSYSRESSTINTRREPILNNLGHVCRKLTQYDEAIEYHQAANKIRPNDNTTMDALGMIFVCKQDYSMAINYFEKALAVKRDDPLAVTMYNMVSEKI